MEKEKTAYAKLSPDQAKEVTLKSWTSQILFLISLVTVVAGFFKWMGDNRQIMEGKLAVLQESVNGSFRDLNRNMKEDYATKEEVRFMKDAIMEIKGDIKETKGKLDGSLMPARRGNN